MLTSKAIAANSGMGSPDRLISHAHETKFTAQSYLASICPAFRMISPATLLFLTAPIYADAQ